MVCHPILCTGGPMMINDLKHNLNRIITIFLLCIMLICTAMIARPDAAFALPQLSWESAEQQVTESAGVVSVKAILSAEATENVSFMYTVRGSAETGKDHILTGGFGEIQPGDTQFILEFEVIEDALYENEETVIIYISQITNADPGQPLAHTVEIQDNDPMPTVEWESPSVTLTLDTGRVVVPAVLSEPSGLGVEVEYEISSGDPSRGRENHDLVGGTLIIPSGETRGVLEFNMMRNAPDYSNGGTLALKLSSPVNAQMGTNDTHTITFEKNLLFIPELYRIDLVGGQELNNPMSGSFTLASQTPFEIILEEISFMGAHAQQYAITTNGCTAGTALPTDTPFCQTDFDFIPITEGPKYARINIPSSTSGVQEQNVSVMGYGLKSGSKGISFSTPETETYAGLPVWHSFYLRRAKGATAVLNSQATSGYFSFGIYDSKGNKLAAGDDSAIRDGEQGIASFTAPVSGVYYIKVLGAYTTTGNYDMTLYKAWYNPDVTDADHPDFYESPNTAIHLLADTYDFYASHTFYHRFAMSGGDTLKIDVTPDINAGGNLTAAILTKNLLQIKDTGYLLDAETGRLEIQAPVDAVYYLKISGFGDTSGAYDIDLPVIDPTDIVPADNDNDVDGLNFTQELYYETDPGFQDTDGDGQTDYQEVSGHTNPLAEDTFLDADTADTSENAHAIPFFDKPFTVIYPDHDVWYYLELRKGEGISAILRSRLTKGKLRATLYDKEGTKAATTGYVANGQTGVLSHTALTGGTYTILIQGFDQAFGEFDFAVHNAWFNAYVPQSRRTFFGAYENARYLSDGTYPLPDTGKAFFVFSAEKGETPSLEITPAIINGKMTFTLYNRNRELIISSGFVYNNEPVTLTHTVGTDDIFYLVAEGFDGAKGKYTIANTSGFMALDPDNDADGDGLYNPAEYYHHTSINSIDTDGDGENDGDEVAMGRDPAVDEPESLVVDGADIIDAAILLSLDDVYNVEYPGTETWYAVNLITGEGMTISLAPHISQGKFRFFLYDAHEHLLKASDYIYNNDVGSMDFQAAVGETFFIKVIGYDGPSGNYDFGVYNAWFNPNANDANRSFYSTAFSGRFVENLSDENYVIPDAGNAYFRMYSATGSTIDAEALAHLGGGKIRLYLYEKNRGEVAASQSAASGNTAALTFDVLQGGVFYLRVAAEEDAYGSFDLTLQGGQTPSDADGDSLNDLQESHFGTDAALADTDGDGTNDGLEVENETDPLTDYSALDPSDAGTQETAIDLPQMDTWYNADYSIGDHWYKFTLSPGKGVTAAIRGHMNVGKFKLYLHNQSGQLVKSTAYVSNRETAALDYTAPSLGTYYLRVLGLDGAYGSYDIGVFNAWFNMGITDNTRSYYGTNYTSRQIENGMDQSFTIPEHGSHFFRFVAQGGANLIIDGTSLANIGKLRLSLYNRYGVLVTASDFIPAGGTRTINKILAQGGLHYLKVETYEKPYGEYLLSVSAVDDPGVDSDSDSLTDDVEYQFGTDPNNPDSDYDGLPDGLELGYSPDADPSTTTNPNKADTDGDGIADGTEDANHNGRVDAGESDPGNHPPFADAGSNIIVPMAEEVILDGTGSLDPDGEIDTWLWEQVSGPTVTLTDADTAQAGFTAPDSAQGGTDMEFSLTVTDSSGESATDNVTISVLWTSTPYVNMGVHSAYPGAQLSIPVTLTNPDNLKILVMTLDVEYDPDVAEATGATLTGGVLENRDYSLAKTIQIGQDGMGHISLTFSALSERYAADGIVAYVDFTVSGNVGTSTDLILEGEVNEHTATGAPGPDEINVNQAAISGKVIYYSDREPISDTKITLTGTASYPPVYTDAQGEYEFTGIQPVSYKAAASKTSDLSGLSGTDASRIARYANGLILLDCHQLVAADVSRDNNVSIFDAYCVARYAAGINEPDCFGGGNIHWVFTPNMGDSCTDWGAPRDYSPLSSRMEDQDYMGLRLGDVTGNWEHDPVLRSAPGFRKTPFSYVAEKDEVIPVFVNLLYPTGIEGIDIEITYNPNVLSLESAGFEETILADSEYGLQMKKDNTNGVIRLVAYALKQVFTGYGKVMKLNFKATGSYGSSGLLSLTSLRANESEKQANLTIAGLSNTDFSIMVGSIGDINESGAVDLTDAILALRVSAGMTIYQPVYVDQDVNNDGAIGLEEAIFALMRTAGL